ncbi:hypothetical protein PT205_26685, partial [Klebsiella pneumoniae]|uniref:hypothetical protein n=1 Tax=Klebsiella pneumoniae TaxID=573 RepID=UPI0023649EE2
LNDPRPVFNWQQAIRQRAIIYVGLDALSDAEIAATPAPSLSSWMKSYALHDDKQTRTHGLRRIAVSRGVPARQSAL